MARYKQYDERKKQILKAAMDVFSRYGFHESNVQQIADEAGIGKGTIYEYFKSKEQIFLTIAESIFEQFYPDIKQLSEGDFRSFVEGIVRLNFEVIREYSSFSRVFFETYARAQSKDDPVHKVIDKWHTEYVKLISEIIKKAQKNREVSSDYHPDRLARIFFASLDGIQLHAMIRPGRFNENEMFEDTVRFFCNT